MGSPGTGLYPRISKFLIFFWTINYRCHIVLDLYLVEAHEMSKSFNLKHYAEDWISKSNILCCTNFKKSTASQCSKSMQITSINNALTCCTFFQIKCSKSVHDLNILSALPDCTDLLHFFQSLCSITAHIFFWGKSQSIKHTAMELDLLYQECNIGSLTSSNMSALNGSRVGIMETTSCQHLIEFSEVSERSMLKMQASR